MDHLIQPDGEIKTPEGRDIDLTGFAKYRWRASDLTMKFLYIPADSLPEGVKISGDGVIAEYDASN
ncbi:hypothetical protein OK016_25155 [Vibrio chagasii]|nr:hypothetical protein [Vibrio chagasii]